jgi:ABC-type transporter Mla MlaB component
MTHRRDLLRMTGSVARQTAIPVEHSRPQWLATNAEDSGELDVRCLGRIAIHRRQVCPQEDVAIRRAAREFG